MKPDIIVICGPTGVGKTSGTIKLAQKFGGRIISADSMQLYRYMDIGTAKPTPDEQAEVKHYMVDIADPDEPFDAARFTENSDLIIKKLGGQGIVPFVAGGTGLYIKALVHGLFRAAPADPRMLEKLTAEADEKGVASLYEKLEKCDPESASKIHANDLFRIIRALEVYESTGMPISRYHADHRFNGRRYRALKICINMDRDRLYERIDRRVDMMIEQGLVEEVEGLLQRGYSPALKSMRSLGYRHICSYLKEGGSWEETVRTLKRDTRRYAKRQLTWFRADPEIIWKSPDELDQIEKLVEDFLSSSDTI